MTLDLNMSCCDARAVKLYESPGVGRSPYALSQTAGCSAPSPIGEIQAVSRETHEPSPAALLDIGGPAPPSTNNYQLGTIAAVTMS